MPVSAQADELPSDFPGVTVTTLDAEAVGEGYIFLAVATETEGIGTYLMILENDGTPVWHQKLDTHEIYDFKVQPNGYLICAPFIEAHSYTGGGDVVHEIWDDSFQRREVIAGGNGYVAEGHDFQVLPNGHILQFGYYMSEVDMSQILEGGHPGALVSGGVVQELDQDRQVVFQWRTWDYYDFESATYGRGSTSPVISAFHLNTINQDPDGHLIVGTPLEIRKINRQTGEVMWVLGGDENQFTPVGEGADVSHFGGHATYRLENGNFLMYDNGPRRGSGTSSVHEYALDEVNLTATHVWSWSPPTDIKAWHRGNAQRLPNGNTFIGWGGASGDHIPVCTEVTPEGEVVYELYFDEADPQVESYRAFRFPYPPDQQRTAYLEFELAKDNEYPFPGTGVTLEIQDLSGDGYNEVTVSREPYAPVYPEFTGKAPRVLPVRVRISRYGIQTIAARVRFDVNSFGFQTPESLTVYHRQRAGQGLFASVPTDYNPVSGEVRALIADFGELVFGYPDVADVPFPPILNQAENYRGEQASMVIAARKAVAGTVYPVNEERPIWLSWSPKGLARSYTIEIATEPGFADPVVAATDLKEANLLWESALPETLYHYRVKTLNEGGESDWSPGAFRTVAPRIEITSPAGGELWEPGREYWIRWNDNLEEDVVIELLHFGNPVKALGTVPSNGVHEWEVDLTLPEGPGYAIRISSATRPEIQATSATGFNIGGFALTALTANGDGSITLDWTGNDGEVYVEFNPTLDEAGWETVAGPLNGNRWSTTPEAGAGDGYYRLRTE